MHRGIHVSFSKKIISLCLKKYCSLTIVFFYSPKYYLQNYSQQSLTFSTIRWLQDCDRKFNNFGCCAVCIFNISNFFLIKKNVMEEVNSIPWKYRVLQPLVFAVILALFQQRKNFNFHTSSLFSQSRAFHAELRYTLVFILFDCLCQRKDPP